MPVLALNNGRIWPNRPESSVEVVEATVIDGSSATADAPGRSVAPRANRVAIRLWRRRMGSLIRSDEQLAGDEAPGFAGSRHIEEARGRSGFDDAAAVEHD